MEKLTLTHVHTQINFNHHSEIIANFQPEQTKLEFEQKRNDDDETRFYSFPTTNTSQTYNSNPKPQIP
jgi:hypothetical protein